MPATTVFRTASFTSTAVSKLFINLKSGTNANSFVADGLQLKFNDDYLSGLGNEDILKPANINENMSSKQGNTLLMVQGRPMPVFSDTAFLSLTNTTVKSYLLQFKAENFDQANMIAYLYDSYTATTLPIDMYGSITTYNFSITADVASKDVMRFKVIFRQNAILPVNKMLVKAHRKQQHIVVDLHVHSGAGIKEYEVERSLDGIQFNKVGLIQSLNSATPKKYEFVDNGFVSSEILYYRIKRKYILGSFDYSNITKVNNVRPEQITIFPNPVVGKSFMLNVANATLGTYTFKLFNSAGNLEMTRQMTNVNGNISEKIMLQGNLLPGLYKIDISFSDGSSLNSTVIIP